MANPYAIDFNSIPFNAPSSNQFSGLGGSPQQALAALGPAYQENFNNALNFSRAQGQQINQGYNTAMEQQLAGQQGIMNTINQYGAGAAQNIADQGVYQSGASMQNLINRGLGNFTVQDAAQRAINYDQGKLNLQLGDYLSQLRTGAQQTAVAQNSQLAQNQLGFLERMTAQYPNAASYGNLATQAGAAQQSAANQGAINDSLKRMQGAANGAPTFGGIGGGGQGVRQSAFSPGVTSYGTTPGVYGGAPTGIGAGAYTSGIQNPGITPDQYWNDQWQQQLYDASAPDYGNDQWQQDLYQASDPYSDQMWQQDLYDASDPYAGIEAGSFDTSGYGDYGGDYGDVFGGWY